MTRTERHVEHTLKRAIDLIGASVGLVVLSPLMATITLGLFVSQGRPILFRQVRPGLHGRPFLIAKFRTMRPPAPGEIAYQTDAVRVTRVGRLLRATSLDELPELWNVARGEMSLVGPRPLLPEYLDSYSARERSRHDVRPGVTSWAVVNGRHTLRFEERLELDAWYVENWDLRLDFRILAMTVRQLLSREHVATIQDYEEIGFRLPSAARNHPDGPPAGRAERNEPR
jgi:lipopolysaccharide/colanic/teichoic acid biosynthesis glycosyltransferase